MYGCLAGSVGLRSVGTIQKAYGLRLQFDDQLLDDMLDRFLAAGYLDGAVIFAGGEFTLHQDMCALAEARSKLAKPCPKATTLCHCVLFFRSPWSSFQERVVATENLVTGVPFASWLVSAFLPMYPMMVS